MCNHMVAHQGSHNSGACADELSDEQVDRVFRALADRTRRDIVRRTLGAATSISELAVDYDMTFAAVQKHVRVLESAALVTRTPRGRERLVRGNAETVRHAERLLQRYAQLWSDRIDQLDALISEVP